MFGSAGRLGCRLAEFGCYRIRRRELHLGGSGGDYVRPIAIRYDLVAEETAEQPCRALRIGGRDHHPRDGAGSVRMGLPLGPPYEVGCLMFAEIDAAHRYLLRIESGGAEPRVAWHAVERDGTGEGLNRQDRATRCRRLRVNRVGVRGRENES